MLKLKNRVKHRVWHTDPWPDPTQPKSLSRWPGDPWPGDPVASLTAAVSRIWMYVVFFPPCDARFCHIYLFSSLAARVFNKLTRLASCAHLVARPNKHTMPTQGGTKTQRIRIRETAVVACPGDTSKAISQVTFVQWIRRKKSATNEEAMADR